MNFIDKYKIPLIIIIGFTTSCKTIEKASTHGLISGYYALQSENKNLQDVYLDISEEKIDVYPHVNRKPDKAIMFTIPLGITDSIALKEIIFKKESIDIDLTSILLKYRPSVRGLNAQLNTDLNIALYGGWRHDNYNLIGKEDPLGRRYTKVGKLGYDIGFFAGLGTTMINAYTSQNKRNDEYSGMIFQTGIAGFIESPVASFGLSIGYDYLLNSDRKIWIYRNKPWIGFIVGVALN
jgi:hypothetical protein